MRPLLKLLIAIIPCSVEARSLTASTPDWPPFFIHDSQTNRGMGWEIFSKCAREIDPSVRFDNYPIRRMFKSMEHGELDLNIMSFKADRVRTLVFGKEPVFENTYGVWTGSHITTSIRKLEDLNMLTIGQLVGLRPSDQFREWFDKRIVNNTNNEALILNEPDQVIKMLASERIDATVISGPEIRWRAERLRLRHKIRDSGYVVKKQEYFFVLSRQSPFYKQDPKILAQLDKCVRTLKRTGEWQRLRTKYRL